MSLELAPRITKRAQIMMLPKANIPEDYLCPINQDIMLDPVKTVTGHPYERDAIEKWFETHSTYPLTNKRLTDKSLISNEILQTEIREWLKNNPQFTNKEFFDICKKGSAEDIIRYLKLGANLFYTDKISPTTILDLIVTRDDANILKAVLEYAKATNQLDRFIELGQQADGTMLTYAVAHGKYEHAKLLLEYGDDANLPDDLGQNGLIIGLKVSREALSAMTFEEYTPLHYAVHSQNKKMIDLLLKYRANPLLPCAEGLSAIELATKIKREDLILPMSLAAIKIQQNMIKKQKQIILYQQNKINELEQKAQSQNNDVAESETSTYRPGLF